MTETKTQRVVVREREKETEFKKGRESKRHLEAETERVTQRVRE